MHSPEISQFLAVFTLLFLYGLLVNRIVEEMELRAKNDPTMEGRTWQQVVLGVAGTLVFLMVLIGWQAAVVCAIGFTLSGLPVIRGAHARHALRVKKMIERRVLHKEQPERRDEQQA